MKQEKTMNNVTTAEVAIPEALLSRVARGEQILITALGKPVALLTSPPAVDDWTPERKKEIQDSIARMKRLRDENGPTLGPDLTIQQLRDEGRR